MNNNEYLVHHGILGMKWGVRRSKEQLGYGNDSKILKKKGESVELHQNPKPFTAKFLAKIIPSIAKNIENYKDYDIMSNDGKKVGNLSTNRDSEDSLNIVWVGVNNKYEGNGYGQSAMRTVISDAKKNKLKNITLEVPTNAPNAKHIYEKLGFKETGEKMLGDDDDIWGGLTKMRLDF